ncbi:MAG: hypothetical protein LC105_04150 [Chitinophagales bacterium]|nr:hypothetical protein [Chitinophagales bacterium]
MKFYIKSKWIITAFIVCIVIGKIAAQDSGQLPKYPPVAITDDERISLKESGFFKQFISMITEEDIAQHKVIYFSVNADNGDAFDRMLFSIYKDKSVIKIQPNQEKLAFVFDNHVNVEQFLKDALESGITLYAISKAEFDGQQVPVIKN